MTQTSTNIAAATPDQVIVLLGASNLTLAWPRIMSTVNALFSGVTHIYTAHGMGRSYLFAQSAFGCRKLPGIFRSGIWDALPHNTPAGKSFAMITDLGNDLLYGSSANAVAKSAEESIERLRRWSPDCKIVMTGPPVAPVHQLGALRFFFARMALFPLTKLTLASAKSATSELNTQLMEIADRHRVSLQPPNADWYGLDPIHVKRKYQAVAFAEFMRVWCDPNQEASQEHSNRPPISRSLRKRPLAETRWLCGLKKLTPQPVASENHISVFAY